MKLKTFNSEQVITAQPGDTVQSAFDVMVDHDIRHLPIVDGGRVVGIVSDRDLLMIVCWISAWKSITRQSTTVGEKRVDELMTAPVSVLSPDQTVEDAARMMLREQIGAVVVEQEGELRSIVTETDVLRCYLDESFAKQSLSWREFAVADYMTASPITGRPTDEVMPTFERMQAKRIRHLPIVDEGRLVGIISDRDLRRSHGREIAVNLARGESDPETSYHATLGDCLSRHVETIDPRATLARAADRMVTCKIGALPVVERDDLLGIITETDLLQVYVRHVAG